MALHSCRSSTYILLPSIRRPQVLGSAIAAFTEVCPDRVDLLHPHYRKLCSIMADIDEWGQVMLLSTLLRYARTQVNTSTRRRVPAMALSVDAVCVCVRCMWHWINL